MFNSTLSAADREAIEDAIATDLGVSLIDDHRWRGATLNGLMSDPANWENSTTPPANGKLIFARTSQYITWDSDPNALRVVLKPNFSGHLDVPNSIAISDQLLVETADISLHKEITTRTAVFGANATLNLHLNIFLHRGLCV